MLKFPSQLMFSEIALEALQIQHRSLLHSAICRSDYWSWLCVVARTIVFGSDRFVYRQWPSSINALFQSSLHGDLLASFSRSFQFQCRGIMTVSLCLSHTTFTATFRLWTQQQERHRHLG